MESGIYTLRERYNTQAELLENAREFRERKLPIDMIVQDWQYWGKYGWNAMKFDEDRYPDPGSMMEGNFMRWIASDDLCMV